MFLQVFNRKTVILLFGQTFLSRTSFHTKQTLKRKISSFLTVVRKLLVNKIVGLTKGLEENHYRLISLHTDSSCIKSTYLRRIFQKRIFEES